MKTNFHILFTTFLLLEFLTLSEAIADHLKIPPFDFGTSISNEQTLAENIEDDNQPVPSIEDPYYFDALKSLEPLTPAQIKNIRRELDSLDQAKVAPITETSPITRSINASLLSGESPFVINVVPGWVSTLTFSDNTGEYWPVQVVTNGNPDVYDVVSSGPDGESNIITISAKQAHIPTNLAILLQGARVPLLATLTPSQDLIDYRIDVRIDQRGPNATPEIITKSNLTLTNDHTMLSFLDGIAPQNARALSVNSNLKLQVWIYQDLMYVRTKNKLISPAFTAKHANASGVKVYALQPVPVLVISADGKINYVNINL